MALLAMLQFAWCALEYNLATTIARLGTEVDDPVGTFYDVHIVLDDYHRVTALDQRVECREQLIDVVEVQTRSRLVEDKHHSTCGILSQHIRR